MTISETAPINKKSFSSERAPRLLLAAGYTLRLLVVIESSVGSPVHSFAEEFHSFSFHSLKIDRLKVLRASVVEDCSGKQSAS